MNILVVGGAGFLGNNLVRHCLEAGNNQVTVLDSLDERLRSDISCLDEVINRIDFVKGDMGDAALMAKLVKGKEVIINCAGQTSHPLSLKDPFFDVKINCAGNLTLLEAVRLHNPGAKVIFTSSSTTIGKAERGVVDESHAEAPLEIYSANKGVAEKYYRIYNRVYDLRTVSLRFANLYGPYGKGYPEFGFINYFIHLADQGEAITVFGEGAQNRNVMFVEDAADLLYSCIGQDHLFGGEVFFAAHREHYSVGRIAREIISVFGRGVLKSVPWPDERRRIEIDDVIISAAKLYYDFQFEPKFNLRQGLIKTKTIMDKSALQESGK